jgi:TatD DNase family protein
MTNDTPGLIDTHAHLDDGQFPDADDVVGTARAAGVGTIVNIGYSPRRWVSSMALAARHPETVAYTLGLHPLSASEYSAETMDALAAAIRANDPVGIGETGLDAYRDGPPMALQRAAFADQIDLALATDLPLVIHMRSTEPEVTAMLRAANPRLRVILHSFDGTMALARVVADRGWHVGVGGLMTRAASTGLREILAWLPLDRMILETDSPYLVPAGVRDRRNTPANLPITARRLADLKGLTLEDVQRATIVNTLHAFPRLGVRAAALEGVVR